MPDIQEVDKIKWYALRDLCRRNALMPGYARLGEMGFEVFTPMKWEVAVRGSKRVRRRVPILADLLFVRSAKSRLDPVVAATSTLQYRYQRGRPITEPTVVADADMERFIAAVGQEADVRYFSPDEIKPEMYGREVRMVGGPFDGFTGRLLSLRGSGKKRLIVEIPHFIAAAVEVQPEFIEFM